MGSASGASGASGTSGASGVPVAVSVAVSAGGESLASGEQPDTSFERLNKDWQTMSFN